MARYSQRPENALKRANEFIEVGKPARALDTLYEVFRNKKWAYNWSEGVLEPIMFKYLDLCVELKKSHIAKEGLFQYRNMFQTVNVGSLENVIRGYLRSAEEKTEAAREHSHQAVLDIDDLDNLATPESILLSAVSGEGAQDRSDRTILTPWVKFLWESYCQCLELLRTNALVESLYHDIARMAYQFCLKYNRKTEFRKLCDKLRKHLEDIAKLPAQAVNVNLTRPETQQYNLETRLIQLDYAIQMELWQEAYKATEDIHNLMIMSKKPPQPKMMANYYQKLAMVFWKAGPSYYLFHAAALFKLYQLNKEMKKNITHEDLQRMANRVLLATLSIPLPSAHPEFDRFIETDKTPVEKAQKLSVLLTLLQPPTRFSLLKDIVRYNVVVTASQRLQDLYTCLEITFNPLQLCKKVDAIINDLKEFEPFVQYISPLKDVTVVTLIRQLAQVYDTISYPRLLELSFFSDHFHVERLIVECVRQNDMQIRIDHDKGNIYFGTDLSESQREDKLEGPVVQDMPSEQIRNHLINMSEVIIKCQQIINPDFEKVAHDALHEAMIKRYHEIEYQEHRRLLQRHQIIEERKEYIEQMNTVREMEEAKRVEELARQQALAEHKRLEMEREERERKRVENEKQQIKDRTLKEKMQQISQTAHGQKILKNLQGEELDAEKIAAREVEELQKERREQQQKMKTAEKKLDYFERAKRIEEIPLFKQAWKDKLVADRKFWEQQEADRILLLKQDRKLALQHRDRLQRMAVDRDIFMSRLKERREVQHEDRIKEFEKQLETIRKERLEQRRKDRIEERKAAWKKLLQEEEERKKQEELKKKQEEERLKKEEEEKVKAIERAKQEEIRRKQDEILEKQRKIEERAALRNLRGSDDLDRVTPGRSIRESGPPKDNTSSNWRDKDISKRTDDGPSKRTPDDGPSKPEQGGWRSARVESKINMSRSEENTGERRLNTSDKYRPPVDLDKDKTPRVSFADRIERSSDRPERTFDRSERTSDRIERSSIFRGREFDKDRERDRDQDKGFSRRDYNFQSSSGSSMGGSGNWRMDRDQDSRSERERDSRSERDRDSRPNPVFSRRLQTDDRSRTSPTRTVDSKSIPGQEKDTTERWRPSSRR